MREQIADLRAALEAIRSGGVDAVVLGDRGAEQVYTLTSADRPYRVMVEEIGEAAAAFSERGIVLYANRCLAELVGCARSDLLGRDVSSLLVSPEPDAVADLLTTVPGDTRRAEVEMVTSAGTHVPVLASVTAMDLDGTTVCCLIAADLTEQRAAQVRLVDSERQLRATALYSRSLIEASLDPLVTISADGKITDVNTATETITGRSRQELIGTDFSDYFESPEDARRGYEQVFRDGQVVDYPLEIKSASGQLTPVLYNATLYRAENGEVAGVFAAARDVREQVLERQKLTRQAEQLAQARAALEIENQRRELVLAGTRLGLWDWNMLTDELVIDDRLLEILGYQRSELEPISISIWGQVIDPEDLAQGYEMIQQHAQGRIPHFDLEARVKRGDGQTMWVRDRGKIAEWTLDGRPSRMTGTIEDVTELHEAREQVCIERARLRAAVDSLLDPHVLLEAVRDDSGEIVDFVYTDANPAACVYNGLPYEDLVGTRLLDLLPGQVASGLLKPCGHVVETGEPLVLDDFRYEQELLGGEQRSYDIRANRVGDGCSFTWRDVTDRHAAAEALVAAERRYRLLADNATDVVILINREWMLTWVSPATRLVLGYDPQDLVGTSTADLIHPDDVPALASLRSSPVDDQVGMPYELRVRNFAGEYRWMSGLSRAALDADGNTVGRISTLRDIHEQVLARQETEHARARLQATMDSLLDPHALLEAVRNDTGTIVDFTFIDANDVACRYLQINREELLGATMHGMSPGLGGSGLFDLYAGVVESGRSLVLDDHQHDFEMMDGTRSLDIRAVRVGQELSLSWRDVTDRHAAAQALALSESRYRGLVDAIPDPTFVFSAVRDTAGAVVDLTYTEINQAAERLYDKGRQDVLGHTILELFPSVGPLGVFDFCADTLENGQSGSMRVPSFDENGVAASFDLTAVPFAGEVIVSARDITASLAAADALAEAERLYHLVAENTTDAVFLLDSSGVFTWVSPAVERVMGHEPSALIGTHSIDLVHPEDMPTILSMIAEVERGSRVVHWEARMRTASGRYRWVSAASGPARDPDGRVVGRLTTARDIHEQVLARQALARSEQTFRLALEGAPHGMAVVGLHGRFQQVNDSLCDLAGYDRAWFSEHSEADLIYPADAESDWAARDRLLAGDAEYDIQEARVVAASGNVLWVQHSLALVRDEHGMPLFYVSQYQDISDARASKANLQYRADHDSLTGLINREELQQRIGRILAQKQRRRGVFALLFCDLDHFKGINDTYGHAAGDHVLKSVADRIASVLRDTDEVARLGGDEFVVVLPEVFDLAAAAEVAQKIRDAVAQPLSVDHGQISITISVGIALAAPGIEANRLLRDADVALYEAKGSGRDRIAVFERGRPPDGNPA